MKLRKSIASVFVFLPLLYFLISTSSNIYAQSPLPIKSSPYFCGFENPVENSYWIFDNGNNKNGWAIGTAINNGGNSGLYISPDNGLTAGHTSSLGYVAVYRELLLDAGRMYQISFDWFNGSTGDFYVCWVDPARPDNPTFWSGSNGIPEYVKRYSTPWTAGDTIMRKTAYWQKGMFEIVGDGSPKRLLFFWSNNQSISNLAGAIDNIQIGYKPTCSEIPEVKYESLENGTGQFSWKQGNYNAKYELKYADTTKVWHEYKNIKTPPLVVPDLKVGNYDIRIRVICNNDTSIWYILNDYYVHKYIKGCLDYIDIYGSHVTATYGETSNPYASVGVINHGSKSNLSRLTVHSDMKEYDSETGYTLKTIPIGSHASVRLGNSQSGNQAESVTYEYIVDSTASLLLLRYALVLQNPKHNKSEQPMFTLKILDEFDNNIDYETSCGEEVFVAGYEGAELWKSAGETTWKDWTGFGMNLKDFIGKKIKIRLTTYDCTQGGHYGYVYFTLDCAMPEITGISCGDSISDVLVAPEGFTYEWFPKNNPDSIVSTSRTFKPKSDDEGIFVCKMTYKEGKCEFALEATVTPRHVVSKFNHTIKYQNCEAEVKFKNESYTWTRKGEIGECDAYEWSFGGLFPKVTDKEFSLVFNTPGDYPVTLKSSIAGGDCYEENTQVIKIREFGDTVNTIKVDKCINDLPYEYNGVYFTKTTKYPFPGTSFAGCDSTTILDFRVHDKFEVFLNEELFLYKDSFYDFHGDTLTESGSYQHTFQTASGCDSIIYLTLTVYPILEMEVINTSPQICADTSSVTLDYIIKSGDFTTYSLLFDEKAESAGFKSMNNLPKSLSGTIEINVPNQITPNVYNLLLVLEDYYSGNDTIPIEITVNYATLTTLSQKWNDVIAVLNSDNNGGYDFTRFQWYKNGIPMLGETKSYIYVPELLDFSAEYQVELTRLNDGVTAFTCPLTPVYRTDADMINVYPTILSSNSNIIIEMPDNGHLDILDVTGLKKSSHALQKEINSISIPFKAGVYLLQVVSDSGDKKMYNIIVK